MQTVVTPYQSINKIRIVTAASLFDGHDASINIMRRILQDSGAEVIHLGHNRSVLEIVDCAIQEDAQAIALTSYQGGHNEYLKYMFDLLNEKGAGHIKIFAGGGGTILPSEIADLQAYGITRVYHPDDGRTLGLQGMINDLLTKCDFSTITHLNGEAKKLSEKDPKIIGRTLTVIENEGEGFQDFLNVIQKDIDKSGKIIPVLGITGTGGAGKSSLTDELVRRFLLDFKDKTIAVVSVDPSKRKTGGALLGDRIRMNSISNPRVFMRSFATREANSSVNKQIKNAITVLKAAQFDLIIVETAGIGQSDSQIVEIADTFLYVMTPEFGAATQLEKIDMLDFADLIAINKFDKRGALDAVRDVKKQFQRNHKLFDQSPDSMPVFGTIASQFNDPGCNNLYKALIEKIKLKTGADLTSSFVITQEMSEKIYIIPPERTRYLAEIVEDAGRYYDNVAKQAKIATQAYQLKGSVNYLIETKAHKDAIEALNIHFTRVYNTLSAESREILESWDDRKKRFSEKYYTYLVRNKEIKVDNYTESLSHIKVPKISVPKFKDWGEILTWVYIENFPGEFPYAAGVYPFKRTNEDPTRMFAGEGGPERTNKRFHYVSKGMPAIRLSTAFDSVTLYGENPDHRPDIYGKIGNSGVSIACLDDAKKLYSGFDLCQTNSSVSMTINGPAPMLLAFFMNVATDQLCEKYIHANGLEGDALNKKTIENYITKWAEVNKSHDIFQTPHGRQLIKKIDFHWDENKALSFDIHTLEPRPTEDEGIEDFKVVRTLENIIHDSLDCSLVKWNGLLVPQFIVTFKKEFKGDLGLRNPLLEATYKKLIDIFVHKFLKNNSKNLVSNGSAEDVKIIWTAKNHQFYLNLSFHIVVPNEEGKEQTRYELTCDNMNPAKFDSSYVVWNGKYRIPKFLYDFMPKYNGPLPEGNNGLGLMLLGVTGDQVLPADVYKRLKAEAISTVRGTVQADILKEDQAQNTCIFSTEFALRMMGDIQQYFIDQKVRNFYSVSISGYHIAEAGANPISQLAFTISNGFTFVEYYLSRGMHIDDFAPNLSFFFSNGMDPEYSVIGRVARIIWSKAIKNKYGGNERSQMMKYHIQTSGRSLHAQEIDFNDIRTTLQALYAIYDNCNSLHTNAYDEAITTPTEESVRRAMAIQLIINRELGQAKNENPLQGSFIIDELTELVEEAVMTEFKRISDRGGVLGAMETMYQRNKIQEESMYYEMQKHTGELPIIGVNTFLNAKGSPTIIPTEVIRSTEEEKEFQINNIQNLHARNLSEREIALKNLQNAAIQNKNVFEHLMETAKYCSLGDMSKALYEVGGQYRRNM